MKRQVLKAVFPVAGLGTQKQESREYWANFAPTVIRDIIEQASPA